MGLADELASAKAQPRSGVRCGVYTVLASLGDDAPALQAALNDDSFAGTAIAKVLRDRGYQIQDNTIQRHRKGRCVCPRTETP